MKSFACRCGSMIFFENTQCVACGQELGWCPACSNLTTLESVENDQFRCGNDSCGALLSKCHNYAVEHVCNRCFIANDEPVASNSFCDYCQFNETIPDLSVEGNREMWARLEVAKRRLLYTLDLLRLPYGFHGDGTKPSLTFDFRADTVTSGEWWWEMGKEERVYTGHANGKITINIREADSVEREKARVMFQEARRTIIGHFRHEIGHYYWEVLVRGTGESAFTSVFGDHENPSYGDAQKQYYENGPPPSWPTNYISAYATMHPFEDFAETFAAYLDMVSVLDTAMRMSIGEGCDPTQAELPTMVDRYIKLGVVLNEMNRAMGLNDLVPEVFAPPIVDKLTYVHDLVRGT